MTAYDSHTLTTVGKFSLITVSHRYAGLEQNKGLLFSRQEHKEGTCKGDAGGGCKSVGVVCT